VKIRRLGSADAVALAAEELSNYLGRILGTDLPLEERESYAEKRETIWVGESSSFPQEALGGKPDRELDRRWDELIRVEIGEKEGLPAGLISGLNPRSVLLAVYRYLTELGCRWVRPGEGGEIVPDRGAVEDFSLSLKEVPSYRHRGICIEGAVSYEHVQDIIDWAPKVGFNAYFTQFRESYTFFARWYEHHNNPYWEGEEFSVERAREYVEGLVGELEKRDMLYHAVGHGWTCEPLGIPGLGWEHEEGEVEVPEDVREYLAQIDGERKLYEGVPLNTNLCYSNPEVREILTEAIADYLEENPRVDLLHFWLADGRNNHCECRECSRHRPADLYVKTLNELDQLLTKRGLEAKIVFLVYNDLLWPPQEEEIKNPERFVLMFAPISRTYSETFADKGRLAAEFEPPPFQRNELDFPSAVEENLAFLQEWEEAFAGDSFDFDYHFMWDHYNDPGYMQIVRVLADDVEGLEGVGLNGYVSCQTQRAFLPTGLGMVVMGRTLYDRSLDFDSLVEDYFRAAFGQGADRCRRYLEDLSELFCPSYLRGERPVVDEEAARSFARIPALVEEFRPLIERKAKVLDGARAQSWEYLDHHADICTGLAEALEERARGNEGEASRRWAKVKELAQKREEKLHPVFDVYEFVRVLGDKMG